MIVAAFSFLPSSVYSNMSINDIELAVLENQKILLENELQKLKQLQLQIQHIELQLQQMKTEKTNKDQNTEQQVMSVNTNTDGVKKTEMDHTII